ncbi:MAG TPA: hypothetical protein VMA13_03760 [Candidatus Saccharimonadales bacterium]|nr:hypothetical protein [Candidatus Saccharimonadales bacterium]
MTRDDAKNILLLYRHGTADAGDPQMAEALALVKQDSELARWFEEHCARQEVLRAKFRQIPAPAGLKEQIISEQMAREKIVVWRRNVFLTAAATAIIVAALTLAALWLHPPASDNSLAIYRSRMVGVALRGYAMDVATNNPVQIRAYLEQNHAPADFVLPPPLKKVAMTGCAIESWQGAKVSMICFRTGKPLPPGEQSDLWLFVVDCASVKNAPPPGPPQLAKVNQLVTAVWIQGDRLYLLGTEGDEQTIRQLL